MLHKADDRVTLDHRSQARPIDEYDMLNKLRGSQMRWRVYIKQRHGT